jgi:2-dehydropantoate 2-reductase
MHDTSYPIGIVGGGAVGTILAAHFERAGRRTILVECGDRYEKLASDGIQVTGLVNVAAKPSHLARRLEDLPEAKRQEPRLWCICTKTWSLHALLPSLQRLLPATARVLSVQNGLGAESMLATVLGSHRVACAAVNFAGGCARDGASVRMVWFNPPNYVGVCEGSNENAVEIAALLTNAGLSAEATSSEQLKKRLFHKTALNAGLNALCAVSGTTMQQAMSMPHTRSLARTLLEEVFAVGRALGHDFGSDALTHAMTYLDRGGDHRPSMAVDLERKNPTEIEFINGRIVELAQAFPKISVPANRFVTSLVVTQEVLNGTRAPTEIPTYLHHA